MKNNNDITWVDVHDDELMVSLGIHLPNFVAPDFAKTPKEKKILKKAKASSPKMERMYGSYKETPYPLYDKLIVHLKKNDNFSKSTYSFQIWQRQIQGTVGQFTTRKGKSVVDYYIWNGKKYGPTELPINPYKWFYL